MSGATKEYLQLSNAAKMTFVDYAAYFLMWELFFSQFFKVILL